MRKRIASVTLVGLVSFLALSFAAAGGEGEPQTSPEERLAAWMALAQPGEEHKALAPLVGSFVAEVTTWEGPEAQPQKTRGTMEATWVLGGRFLRQVVKGSFLGEPFEGLGYLGFDRVKKKYLGVWMDSMGTGIMLSEGAFDAKSQTFTSRAEMDDPASGQKLRFRETLRILPDGNMFSESFVTGPDGKEFKNMEISYRRK